MDIFSIFKPMRNLHLTFLVMIFFCSACSTGELPLNRLKKSLAGASDYSIVLEDMKRSGNFSTRYFHKYQIIQDTKNDTTSWMEVPKNFYQKSAGFLGMTIAAKKDGEEINSPSPPGYQHVGDSRYGQWRNDHRGNSFWEFYGKYALFSTLIGGFNRPIYRGDYNAYRSNRSRNTPFYGRNKEFGTNGSFTKKSKPNFYTRRATRDSMKKSSFNNKVSKRIGRTRSGYRGRAGGFGK